MSFFVKLISVLTLSVAFTRATITIQTQNLIGNTTDTIHWTSSDPDSDPESITMELNHPSFHSNIAIANNVPTADLQLSFQMPDVLPQGGYSLLFVENGNITNIFATSGKFFVIENDISGPHTGLVSPTLPPPSPSTTSSFSTSSTSNSTSISSTSSPTSAPSTSSSLPATTPVVVIPNPSGTSGNSSIINGPNNNGAGSIQVSLAATFLALVASIL